MSAVFNVVLPVFAIMLAGYLAGRFRVLGEPSSEALNRFVYFVALPALFFISMARSFSRTVSARSACTGSPRSSPTPATWGFPCC
jgi:predicted permease